MKKRTSISMVVAILAGLLMLLPVPAAASPPEDVTFEFYGNLVTGESTFSASGAVTDSGTYEETRLNFADGTAHGTVTTTSDAGTITFKWQARITSETATAGFGGTAAAFVPAMNTVATPAPEAMATAATSLRG